MTLYETLGVSPDATPEEIKNAYRAKAHETHPDKPGNDASDFVPVVQAYEVLSNPERRLLYDASGQEGTANPIEVEARNILLGLIQQNLQANDIVAAVRDLINGEIAKGPALIKQGKKEIKALEKKKKRVKSKGEMNLIHMVIDGQIKGIAAQIAAIEYKDRISAICLSVLDEYDEEKYDAPSPWATSAQGGMRIFTLNLD